MARKHFLLTGSDREGVEDWATDPMATHVRPKLVRGGRIVWRVEQQGRKARTFGSVHKANGCARRWFEGTL